MHKNHLYTCKKQCRELSKVQTNNGVEASNTYFDLCIKVENPKTSIYSYCDDNFVKSNEKTICKVDTCRLCCVTSDQMNNMNIGIVLLNKCFEKCAQTWKFKKEVGDLFK